MGGHSTNCPDTIEIKHAKEAIVTYQNGKTERKVYTPLPNDDIFKDKDRGHIWFEAQDIPFQKYYPELVEIHKRGVPQKAVNTKIFIGYLPPK